MLIALSFGLLKQTMQGPREPAFWLSIRRASTFVTPTVLLLMVMPVIPIRRVHIVRGVVPG